MKSSVERYFCDYDNCDRDSLYSCAACGRDVCDAHRNWLSTQYMNGAVIGQPVPATGFTLCKTCRLGFERTAKLNRQKRGLDVSKFNEHIELETVTA